MSKHVAAGVRIVTFVVVLYGCAVCRPLCAVLSYGFTSHMHMQACTRPVRMVHSEVCARSCPSRERVWQGRASAQTAALAIAAVNFLTYGTGLLGTWDDPALSCTASRGGGLVMRPRPL